MLGETFVPPYTVRCFIAKDKQHARWGVAGGGIFLLLFLPIATFILGTSAQINPEVQAAIENEKQQLLVAAADTGVPITEDVAQRQAYQVAFPTLVRVTFHPVFAGVMIAVVMLLGVQISRLTVVQGAELRARAEERLERRSLLPTAGCIWQRARAAIASLSS